MPKNAGENAGGNPGGNVGENVGGVGGVMEEASVALSRMDYLTCEMHCLHALSLARQAEDWPYYRRILMPLQECRRQRRMIAAEGKVRLGTSTLSGPIESILSDIQYGCVVVSHPHTPDDAKQLITAARQQHRHIEVLFTNNHSDGDLWKISAFGELSFHIERPAPPAIWRENYRDGGDKYVSTGSSAPKIQSSCTIADWFIDTSELLGDAGINHADQQSQPMARLIALEKCIDIVTDHEKLHQRLWDTATQLIA